MSWGASPQRAALHSACMKSWYCRPACGTMKRAYLNIVTAGYGACVLDSGCQVAALSQGLKHAACGVVELAHL